MNNLCIERYPQSETYRIIKDDRDFGVIYKKRFSRGGGVWMLQPSKFGYDYSISDLKEIVKFMEKL